MLFVSPEITRTAANEAPPTLSCWKSFLNASRHKLDTCKAQTLKASRGLLHLHGIGRTLLTLGAVLFISGARMTMMLLWKLK